MAYTRNPDWKDYPDESTPITGDKLDHIEDGLVDAAADADAANAGLAGKADVSHAHVSTDVTDFTEAVGDKVNELLVEGSNITLAYDDTANTLTISAAGGTGGGLTEEQVDDRVAALLQEGSNITLTYNDVANTLTIDAAGGAGSPPDATASVKGVLRLTNDLGGTADAPTVPGLTGKADVSHAHVATDITDFTEAVGDKVGELLVEGANITLDYNDAAGTLTISAAGGSGGGASTPAIISAMPVIEGMHCPTNPWFVAGAAGGVLHSTATGAGGFPFVVGVPIEVDQLTVEVTTANANKERHAVYAANANGKPGSLLWDSGQFDGSTTGKKTLACNLILPAGVYWFITQRGAGPLNYQVLKPPANAYKPTPNPLTTESAAWTYAFGTGYSPATPYPPTWTDPVFGTQSRDPYCVALHVTKVG